MNPLRLTNLSTQLFRHAEFASSTPLIRQRRTPASAAAFFHISRQRAQGSRPERYGTAKRPPPHLSEGTAETSDKEPAEPALTEEASSEKEVESESTTSEAKALPPQEPKASPVSFPSTAESVSGESAKSASSLDRVLDVSSPHEPEESKSPHLQAPKYVHHFDTWGLVKDLEKGGFSQDQTVTLMKAVRSLLSDNIDLARNGLVSKSNVENVGPF
jgi:coiled-coil family 90 protein